MSFKLQIVGEVERGEISRTAARRKYGIGGKTTVLNRLKKYGAFDWSKPVTIAMQQTPEQRIKELEAKLSWLEKDLSSEKLKTTMLNTLIEIAEQELDIPIRKKSLPEQSKNFKKRHKKR